MNISECGIFFKTNQPLSIGLRIRLMLNIPARLKLSYRSIWQFTGRVTHIEPMGLTRFSLGVGVNFCDGEPAINRICEGIRNLGDSLVKPKTELRRT